MPSAISVTRFCAMPRLNSIKCFLPLRRTVKRNHCDKAFTHETPTPCRPPETLSLFWSNLPPACSSVITISAALRLGSCLSSSLTSVGMPRPLSSTETALSARIGAGYHRHKQPALRRWHCPALQTPDGAGRCRPRYRQYTCRGACARPPDPQESEWRRRCRKGLAVF